MKSLLDGIFTAAAAIALIGALLGIGLGTIAVVAIWTVRLLT